MRKHYLINRYLRWCCFSIALLSFGHLANAQEHVYANATNANGYSRQTMRSLRDVLPELQARFNVSFVYEPTVIEGKEVSGDVSYSHSIEKTLNAVLTPVGLKYSKVNKSTYSISSSSIISAAPAELASEEMVFATDKAEGAVTETSSGSAITSMAHQEVDVLVTGRVTDPESNPIPGANILIKGTAIGTTTDTDGKFSLNVP